MQGGFWKMLRTYPGKGWWRSQPEEHGCRFKRKRTEWAKICGSKGVHNNEWVRSGWRQLLWEVRLRAGK